LYKLDMTMADSKSIKLVSIGVLYCSFILTTASPTLLIATGKVLLPNATTGSSIVLYCAA
jgi:hypothetical protein